MDAQPITIKKNGKWYYGQVEMFRRNIINVLASNIQKTGEGEYQIVLGNDVSPVMVEDVPFLASGYCEEDNGLIKLVFFDLQEFVIDRELKVFFKGDIPYVSFKWDADTRLSRGVYWKLSQYFEFRGDEIFIVPPVASRLH
ncbi:MAG: DUF1285 domain-containing protein [Syntrophomonadaceae bacterium]|nr:DUF1285 domain-containing protein [Syntrophomonadaceae bacterium]